LLQVWRLERDDIPAADPFHLNVVLHGDRTSGLAQVGNSQRLYCKGMPYGINYSSPAL
jgi:hypothetical protein